MIEKMTKCLRGFVQEGLVIRGEEHNTSIRMGRMPFAECLLTPGPNPL